VTESQWHPEPDELVALAVTDVDAVAQEKLVAHLADCQPCRDEYAKLSDGVQYALTATPALAPPAGFSGRVLAAMTSGSTTQASGRASRTRLLMVACVLIGLVAGIGGVLGVNAWLNRAPAAVVGAPVATRLITGTGDDVGSVGLARRDGRRYLLLNVTTGTVGSRYECILVASDGSRLSGGEWTLRDENGRGTASGAWLVPIAGEPPVSVELVTPTGKVWAKGSF